MTMLREVIEAGTPQQLFPTRGSAGWWEITTMDRFPASARTGHRSARASLSGSRVYHMNGGFC